MIVDTSAVCEIELNIISKMLQQQDFSTIDFAQIADNMQTLLDTFNTTSIFVFVLFTFTTITHAHIGRYNLD